MTKLVKSHLTKPGGRGGGSKRVFLHKNLEVSYQNGVAYVLPKKGYEIFEFRPEPITAGRVPSLLERTLRDAMKLEEGRQRSEARPKLSEVVSVGNKRDTTPIDFTKDPVDWRSIALFGWGTTIGLVIVWILVNLW